MSRPAPLPETATAPPSIRIDRLFQNLIRPLSQKERQQLEENLQREGCRDPLVVWGDILIDGHHRFDICKRLKIKYTTTVINFTSRAAVEDWIDTNQLGRRNLTPDQVSYVRGRIYRRQRKTAAQAGARGGASTGQNVHRSDTTAERLAKEHGVTERTIRRDGQFTQAVESLAPVVPDIEQRVMNGTVPSKAAVLKAARAPERAAEILTKKAPHVTHNSRETNEWYTPAEYVNAARRVLETIDLDPASCEEANTIVKAKKIFTVKDNGLKHAWAGRVWMNPPYGTDLIEQFTEKLVTHVKTGEIKAAIVLVNNATETKWFQALVPEAHAICFPKGRIKFRMPGGKEPGAPTQGQALLYFCNSGRGDETGKQTRAFIREFSRFGCAVRPADQFEM